MQGWFELSSYSLAGALLLGTLTALSFWGVGNLLCRRWLAAAPSFLRLPTECVAGTIVVSLVVQCLAILGSSPAGLLRGIWFVTLACGVIAAARAVFSARSQWRGVSLFWIPALILALAMLLAGAAPETRSDEVAYHALVTARPIVEGALRFHPLPWEASVVPQMVWHFALTPLYAVSGSAAGGVASVWFALVLALSTGQLVESQTGGREVGGSREVGAVAALIVLAGGYGIVFFTTTGPHAFAYLAVFVAMTAVGFSREIRESTGQSGYALAVGIGCAGTVASKVTMLPVAAIISCFAIADLWWAPGARARPPLDRSLRERLMATAPVILIPAVWLGIPVLWTWAAAGSPLGALTAHLFHASSFDAESLSAYEGTRELFANNFQWRFEAAYWNLPLIVLAILGVGFEKARDRRFRWWLMTGCQFLVIIALLPKEIRHLGGIQYPLMASGMVWLVTAARERGFTQRAVALFAGAGCLPWLAFALWISSIYVPLATGQLTPAEFLRKYSGLQVDYEMLDKALPRDASILVGRSRSDVTQYAWYSRPPVYYAPRPVLFSAGEAEGKSHVYLMYLGQGAEGKHGAIPFDPYLPPGEALGRNVYSNAQSRFYPSRTPGGTPGLARLDVFELLPRRDVAATVP